VAWPTLHHSGLVNPTPQWSGQPYTQWPGQPYITVAFQCLSSSHTCFFVAGASALVWIGQMSSWGPTRWRKPANCTRVRLPAHEQTAWAKLHLGAFTSAWAKLHLGAFTSAWANCMSKLYLGALNSAWANCTWVRLPAHELGILNWQMSLWGPTRWRKPANCTWVCLASTSASLLRCCCFTVEVLLLYRCWGFAAL